MNKRVSTYFFSMLGLMVLGASASGAAWFSDWPDGADPKPVGTKLTERFLASPHPNFGNPGPPGEITYPESVTWYGALTFAQVSGQPELTKRLIARFEPLFNEEAKLIPRPHHVDPTVFGALACELYLQTGDQRYREIGQRFADVQWEPPAEIKKKLGEETKRRMQRGLSWQTRFWIDDMYMITMAQGQAFRATKDSRYVDRAAAEMVVYLDKLRRPNGREGKNARGDAGKQGQGKRIPGQRISGVEWNDAETSCRRRTET